MEPRKQTTSLRGSATTVRGQALDLLRDASLQGLGRDPVAHEAVARLQRVTNDLGKVVEALPAEKAVRVPDPLSGMKPPPSGDAAVVLTLAAITIPSAAPDVEKAVQWLRILRLYGTVGAALSRLGVPEAPFATVAETEWSNGSGSEALVPRRAAELARSAGAPTVDTVHVLFAVRAVFGPSLDRALYARGTTWEQLTESLVSTTRPAPA